MLLVFQECFKESSTNFKRCRKCFNYVSRPLQGSFMITSWVFQGCFKYVLRNLQRFLNPVVQGAEKVFSKVFQTSFQFVSWKFQWCVKSVSDVLPGTFKGVYRNVSFFNGVLMVFPGSAKRMYVL